MTTTTARGVARTAIDMADAATFWADHTEADRALTAGLLVAAGAVRAYLPPVAGYVGYENAMGEVVAYVHATYVTITEMATRMPDADPKVGRPMKATGHVGRGWDVYLSTWTRPKDEPKATRTRTRRVAVHVQEKCFVDGCGVWVQSNEVACRRHAL